MLLNYNFIDTLLNIKEEEIDRNMDEEIEEILEPTVEIFEEKEEIVMSGVDITDHTDQLPILPPRVPKRGRPKGIYFINNNFKYLLCFNNLLI